MITISQKTLIVGFFALLLFTACKKEKIIEVREVNAKRSWSLDSTLSGVDKIILASYPVNDSILAVANSFMMNYVNVNHIGGPTYQEIVNPDPHFGYMIAPRLTESIGVSLMNSGELKIFSMLYPTSDFGPLIYTPIYKGSANSRKAFPIPSFPYPGYPVIKSKYILVPTEVDQSKQAYASLLTVKRSSSNPFGYPDLLNAVSLVEEKLITLNPAPGTLGFSGLRYYSAAFFDKFFLHLHNQFYRIDTLGNVKGYGFSPVPGWENGQVWQMFRIGNLLFAGNIFHYFVSQDQGETWSHYADVHQTPFGNLVYFNVGEELYAYYRSQLWHVTLSGETLNFQELDSDGLDGSQITSVNKIGKYVFVSTLSGLYYREFSSLNTPKK